MNAFAATHPLFVTHTVLCVCGAWTKQQTKIRTNKQQSHFEDFVVHNKTYKKGTKTHWHARRQTHTHTHASQHSVQIKLSTLFTNINFPTKPMYVWQPWCGGSPDFSFLPEKFSFISKFSAEFSINFVSAVSITDEEKTIILIRFRCYCFGVFEPNSIPLKFLIKL